MAGVTEELSILSGSALPAGLSAILREGTMAKVVVAGSARSPGAPQALRLRAEAADASLASPCQSSEPCPAAVEDQAGLVLGAGTSVSQRGTTRSPNSSPLEPGGESRSR